MLAVKEKNPLLIWVFTDSGVFTPIAL